MARILSRRKREWVGKRTVKLKGEPLRANISIEVRYQKEIDKLLNQIAKDAEKELKALFKSDVAKGFAQDASLSSRARILMNKLIRKWNKEHRERIQVLSKEMVSKVDDQASISLKTSLEKLAGLSTIKTTTITGRLKESLTASIAENTDLIKSVTIGYLEQVKGDVLRSIVEPDSGGLKGLQDRINENLSKRYKQHKNKAKNIALDQTRKVYSNINAERMQAVGVKKFEWIHSGGGQKPRKLHQGYNGKVYSFDKLPIIDERTGQRGLPGQAINCRCTMTPVIEFEDGEEK